MALQADYRAAAVSLLSGCASAASVKMQVYSGRPATLYPPTGFVDRMGDELTPTPGASDLFTHAPVVEILTVWGLFDSAEAVDQRDAFVDAFHEYIRTRHEEAGARTLIAPRTLADEPAFVPDWLPEEQQRVYYATRIVLEGFATD